MTVGSLVGVATILLISASGADAAKRSIADIRKSLNTKDGKSTKGSYSRSSTKRVSASAKCSSSAWTEEYESHMDSYIKAVADVVAGVCDPAWYGSPVEATKTMRGWASAYAKAAAKATAECTTKTSGGGKAEGCAYSEADSNAAARAYAEVHAKASAEAFAEFCSCGNAEAWSFNEANIFLDLWAEAYAEASAAACASGNQKSSAEAYADCYGNVISETFAFAAAKASANAGCGAGYKNIDAQTEVQARVNAETNEYSSCQIRTNKKGLSKATAKGNGNGSSKARH